MGDVFVYLGDFWVFFLCFGGDLLVLGVFFCFLVRFSFFRPVRHGFYFLKVSLFFLVLGTSGWIGLAILGLTKAPL